MDPRQLMDGPQIILERHRIPFPRGQFPSTLVHGMGAQAVGMFGHEVDIALNAIGSQLHVLLCHRQSISLVPDDIKRPQRAGAFR